MMRGMAATSSQSNDDEGISLQQLSDAFAEMWNPDRVDGAVAAPDDEGETDVDSGAAVADESAAVCPVTPQSVLESLLFVGHPDNQPLTASQIAELIQGVEPAEVAAMVDQLNNEYHAAGHPFEIVSHGAGFRLVLRAEHENIRARFYGRIRLARLSQAAIEVLALVAYHQPMTGDCVSKLRGHPSAAILSQLVRRKLLRIEIPQRKPRRREYSTTLRFLELFGMRSLDELPKSQELET